MPVRSALAIPLAVLLLAACAPRVTGEPGPRRETAWVGEARVEVVYWPEDAAAAQQVVRAVAQALPRTARWGGLDAPITITIYPTHAALEQAVRRPGFDWLRAWARYATIDLQSPSTWGLFGATDAQVVELLTHELTHCVMYQRAGTDMSWSLKGIPLWFREGMASATAGQGHKRGSMEDLWRFYEQGLRVEGAGDGETSSSAARVRAVRGQRSDGDPLGDPDPLYQDRSDVVYGAAHHAFVFLTERYGEARVVELLRRTQAGPTFTRAFAETYGISEAEFGNDFRRYVVWQGWRRNE